MRGHISLAAGVCLLALFSISCQPPDSTKRIERTEWPIINGVEDTKPEHMAVVFMSNISGWCSGTLISPTVVLTAAHCADAGTPAAYTIYFGNESPDFETRDVVEVIYHPDWDHDSGLENDIALLRLDLPAPGGISPIPHLPESLALLPADLGTNLEHVGFGRDENSHLGTKKTITLPIHFICINSGGCSLNYNGYNFNIYENNICNEQDSGGICSGDSGGPAFITIDSVEYVAEITSYGFGSSCDLYACGTKVDEYETFINGFIGSFAVNGQICTNPAQCYSGYCVDGTCCENECTDECHSCDVPRALGVCSPSVDGEPCPDTDPCNGYESCQAGICVSDAVTPDCTPVVPCVTGACVTGQGCVHTPVADGQACDNSDLCDGIDQCISGSCVSQGTSLDCDDSNDCTVDSCDALQGCQYADVADETSCSDGDLCNGAETCLSGVCQTAGALNCDDSNTCTIDSCDSAGGCQHEKMADGEKCADGRSCKGGLCLPSPSSGCSTSGSSPIGFPAVLFLLFFLAGLVSRSTRLN
ncbi:MAG: trypsin-like serine protease [Deltaproteobacteria bacterium]|nr:trypsin-like serine protease [Deltaproteobacteria bacterium]